jgi:hypothetical protein
MTEPWLHEIARELHQDRLAEAERYRSARSVGDLRTHRRTASHRLKFLLMRSTWTVSSGARRGGAMMGS